MLNKKYEKCLLFNDLIENDSTYSHYHQKKFKKKKSELNRLMQSQRKVLQKTTHKHFLK